MKVILFFALEIFLFSYFAEIYGFLNTLLCYWSPTLIALYLLPRLNQKLQMSVHQNAPEALHAILINLGLLSIILPFFTLRILGLLLVIPGPRHLLIWKLGRFVKAQVSRYQTSTWSTTYGPSVMKDVTPNRSNGDVIEISKKEI